MPRIRSRVVETESVNQRMLRRGAVKRSHISRWAVGRDELAPGVVGDRHLGPGAQETIRTIASGTGVGQLLVVSATGQSFADDGGYVTADTIVYQHGFDQVTAVGDEIVWPTDAVGEVQVEFLWDTYEGGGTIEVEVDGTVPAWGTIAAGSAGSEGCKRRGVHILEGQVVKVKVTQTSGSAKTGDVLVEFSIPDPTLNVTTSPYAAAVLADGPIAYWRLNESSGTSAADATGNGHTGTYENTPTLGVTGVMTDGSRDSAVNVGGTQHVLGSDWSDLEFPNLAPYTLEMWIRPDAVPGNGSFALLLAKQGAFGALNDGWDFLLEGTASGAFIEMNRGADEGKGVVKSDVGAIVADVTYYIAATFDGSELRLYINGVVVDDDTTSANMTTNSAVLSIGRDAGSNNWNFDGDIDEVAIYDRALTPTEVTEHYEIGTSG